MTTRLEMVVEPGRELAGGRYVVDRPIGSPGGEGAVYRAWDRATGRHVAVKVVHPGLYGMFRAAFDAQIRFIAAVDNPWCIEVFDHFTIPAHGGWQETAALVMRLAEGSLADLIGAGGAPRQEALDAAVNAAHGLSLLHRMGGTHNDVKPHNLLRVAAESGPRWVVGDFGVAKLLDGTHAYQQSMDMRYAPPERIRWGQVRRPGDVFSLGMTLHEALCGELPGGYGDYVVANRMPPGPAGLIAACLRPDPTHRPSMDEVEAALVRLGGVVRGPGPSAVPPRRSVTLPPARPAPAGPAPGGPSTAPPGPPGPPAGTVVAHPHGHTAAAGHLAAGHDLATDGHAATAQVRTWSGAPRRRRRSKARPPAPPARPPEPPAPPVRPASTGRVARRRRLRPVRTVVKLGLLLLVLDFVSGAAAPVGAGVGRGAVGAVVEEVRRGLDALVEGAGVPSGLDLPDGDDATPAVGLGSS